VHSVIGVARVYDQYAVSDKVGEWTGPDYLMNGFVLGLGLYLLSLRSMDPTPPTEWAGKVFSYISLNEHLGDFARGVIDTRHVVFYLSATAFFLFLTHKVVESRRWK